MRKIPIAYQGISGSYSQQAIEDCGRRYGLNFRAVSCDSFQKLFETIINKTHLGLVPIENSTSGSVVECYDLFLEYDCKIIGESFLRINHCLLTKPGIRFNQIHTVYSHHQAISQCSHFIEENSLKVIPVFDTAGSAKLISEMNDKNSAAIASELAASMYNLKIIKKSFQNRKNNVTRFLLVKKNGRRFVFEKSNPFSHPDKSTLIFETRDIPSALYKCLGGFATNKVNLTKIESRPMPGRDFEYLFYVDFDGTLEDRSIQLAMEELKFFSQNMVFLGSYKKQGNL